MFLIEKGLEIERIECITPKIVLNESFQARYPHYMVPMLELKDGTQIGEALAIWTYLETLYPQPPLMAPQLWRKPPSARGSAEPMTRAWSGTPKFSGTRIPTSSTVDCQGIASRCRRYRR